MKGKLKITGFALFICFMVFLVMQAKALPSLASDSKNGIDVEVIENTDFCNNETCHTKYEVCFGLTPLNIGDLSVKFRNDNNVKSLTTDYKTVLKANPTIDVVGTKPSCYEIDVYGTKGMFENVDNVLCFNDVCFDKFVWWNRSFPFRTPINFTNPVAIGSAFAVNDTFGLCGDVVWTAKVSETMYWYMTNQTCPSDIAIGNETDQLFWENDSSAFNGNYDPSIYTAEWCSHINEINASDSCGSANGTGFGDPSVIAGQYGNATEFDGNDFITTPFGSGEEVVTNRTIALYFKNTSAMDSFGIFFGSEEGGQNGQWASITPDDIRFKALANTKRQFNRVLKANWTSDLFDGNWHHLAFKRNGTTINDQFIYIDGVMLTAYVTINNDITNLLSDTFTFDWFLASANTDGSPGEPLVNGAIDEFKVWERDLTDAEIQVIYWNGVNNLTSEGTQEELQLNTSLLHADFDIEDVVFDSSSYISIGDFVFNLSVMNNLTFKGSGNAKKQTIPSPSEISIRITVNDVVRFDQPIRTVSVLADIGVFTLPFFEVEGNIGNNTVLVEAKETGSGFVNISNFVIHSDFALTNSGNPVDHSISNATFDFTGSQQVVYNFSVNNSLSSKTVLDTHHTVTATGSTVVSCYLNDSTRTPTYRRFLSGIADVGSTGINFIDETQTVNTLWTLVCSEDNSKTVSSDFTEYHFSLTDSGNRTISSFQLTNETSFILGSGTHKIMSRENYIVREGNQLEIAVTVIINSTSGTQTPIIKLNSTDLPAENCSAVFPRYIESNDDFGTVKFYVNCNNITVDQNYTFNLYAIVEAGETLGINNISMSGYEATQLDIVTGNLPPIPNSIINPENNSIVFGETENITWLAFSEPNGQAVTYNISLFNKTGDFNLTIQDGVSALTISVNYTQINNSNYDLVVEGCDTSDLCANTTHNITVIATPTCNVTFNVSDSEDSTDLTRVNISCSDSFIAVNQNSPFVNLFEFGFISCDLNRTGYEDASTNLSCTGTDFNVTISMVRIIPEVDLNLSLTFELSDLPLVSVECVDNVTLRKEYLTTVTTLDGSQNLSKFDLELCGFGCDKINRRCMDSPITTIIIFIVFLVLMALALLIPLFLITRRSRKKKLMLIIHITVLFITFLAYISILVLLSGVVTFFSIDLSTMIIVFYALFMVYYLLVIMLFVNNIVKRRYS